MTASSVVRPCGQPGTSRDDGTVSVSIVFGHCGTGSTTGACATPGEGCARRRADPGGQVATLSLSEVAASPPDGQQLACSSAVITGTMSMCGGLIVPPGPPADEDGRRLHNVFTP